MHCLIEALYSSGDWKYMGESGYPNSQARWDSTLGAWVMDIQRWVPLYPLGDCLEVNEGESYDEWTARCDRHYYAEKRRKRLQVADEIANPDPFDGPNVMRNLRRLGEARMARK